MNKISCNDNGKNMESIVQEYMTFLTNQYEEEKEKLTIEYETWLEKEKHIFEMYKKNQLELYMKSLFSKEVQEITETNIIVSFLQTMMTTEKEHEKKVEEKYSAYQHHMNRIEMIYHYIQNELNVKEKDSSWFGLFESDEEAEDEEES
jgi:hypothetical protein